MSFVVHTKSVEESENITPQSMKHHKLSRNNADLGEVWDSQQLLRVLVLVQPLVLYIVLQCYENIEQK